MSPGRARRRCSPPPSSSTSRSTRPTLACGPSCASRTAPWWSGSRRRRRWRSPAATPRPRWPWPPDRPGRRPPPRRHRAAGSHRPGSRPCPRSLARRYGALMRPIPAPRLGDAHGLMRAIAQRERIRLDEFVTDFTVEELFPPDLDNALGRTRQFVSYARLAGLLTEDRGTVELTEMGKRYVRAGDAAAAFDGVPAQAEWLGRLLCERHLTDSIYHGAAVALSLYGSNPPDFKVSTLDFGRALAHLGRAGWDNENTFESQARRYTRFLQDMELLDDERRLTPTGQATRGELTLAVHMSLKDLAGQLNPDGPEAAARQGEEEYAAQAAQAAQAAPAAPAPAPAAAAGPAGGRVDGGRPGGRHGRVLRRRSPSAGARAVPSTAPRRAAAGPCARGRDHRPEPAGARHPHGRGARRRPRRGAARRGRRDPGRRRGGGAAAAGGRLRGRGGRARDGPPRRARRTARQRQDDARARRRQGRGAGRQGAGRDAGQRGPPLVRARHAGPPTRGRVGARARDRRGRPQPLARRRRARPRAPGPRAPRPLLVPRRRPRHPARRGAHGAGGLADRRHGDGPAAGLPGARAPVRARPRAAAVRSRPRGGDRRRRRWPRRGDPAAPAGARAGSGRRGRLSRRRALRRGPRRRGQGDPGARGARGLRRAAAGARRARARAGACRLSPAAAPQAS